MSKAGRWLVVCALLCFGCGTESAKPEADAGDVTEGDAQGGELYEVELFATTRVIDLSNVGDLLAVDADWTLHFRTGSPIADALAVDDVVLALATPLTPNGLLRQVTTLAEGEGEVIAATKPAPVELAFKRLRVKVSRQVVLGESGDSGNRPADTIGVERLLQPLGTGPLVVDFYAFNGDGDTSTPEDQVRVTGTFEGTIGYDFEMSIEWPDFTGWPPDVVPDIKASLDVTLGADAGLEVSGMAAKGFSRKETLATIPLLSFWVGVLYFTPEITIDVEMEGGAAGAYDLSMGASASLSTGASIETDGDADFDPPSPSFDFTTPQVTSSWHAYARASVGPTLHVRLYESIGPYAGLRAFAQLDADQAQDPCWSLRGGLDGVIGFDMRVAGLELADWSKGFGIAEKELATGACQPSPQFDEVSDVIDPTFEPWSALVDSAVSTFTTEDSFTGVTPTVDGRYLVSGEGVRHLTKLDPDGHVLWSRKYLLDDAVLPVPLDITTAVDTLDTGIVATGHAPLVLLKLDAQGELLWTRSPQVPYQPPRGFSAQAQAPGGDTLLAGAAILEDMGTADVWVTRLDSQGQPLWSRRWGAPERSEEPTAIVLLGEDIVVLGRSFAVGQDPANQSFALRLTADGTPVWEREIRGCDGLYGDLTFRRAVRSRDGDILVGGRYDFASPRAILLKLKPDGTVPWANGAGGEFLGPDLNDLVQLSDGGMLAAGTWWTASQDDVWLARTDSVGRFLWLQRYDSGVADAAPGLALSGEGGVLMVSNSELGEEGDSLWAMRLPVQDGAIGFAPASGFTATAPDWTDVEGVCLENHPSSLPSPADWPVEWSAAPVTSTPLSPVVTTQAP